MTLGFLGSVQESDARRAWERIGEFPSFRMVTGSFSGVEPLGHPSKPSALCAMVDDGREPLAGMITEARQTLLSAAGAPEDTRPPTCRCGSRQDVLDVPYLMIGGILP